MVNLIHGYAENGDPFIRRFTNQLLEEVSPPVSSVGELSHDRLLGFKTVLRYLAQMAILRRIIRPVFRFFYRSPSLFTWSWA